MVMGNLCIGIAVSLLRLSHFGTDPFSTMNLGVSGFIDVSFGVYQLIFNLFILIIQFIFARNAIGVGTIVNMVGIGFISDFFVYGYQELFGPSPLIVTKIIFLLISVVIVGIGVALYMTADMGISPWDAMPLVIQNISHNKIPFIWARMMQDILGVVIGFSFGAVVGVATVIMAFGIGPLVQYFRKHLTEPLLRNNRAALSASINLNK